MNVLTNENNPLTLKIIISALFGKKEVNVTIVNPYELTDCIIKRLPILKLSPEKEIFSPNIASRYLFPPTNSTAYLVDQILEWESSVLTPTLIASSYGKNNIPDNNVLICLQKIESYLENNSFMTGPNITVADVSVFSSLYPLVIDKSNKTILEKYIKVSSWIQVLNNLPEIKEALKKIPINSNSEVLLSINSATPTQFRTIFSQFCNNKNTSNNRPEISDSNLNSPSHQSYDAITAEELKLAEENWLNGAETVPSRKPFANPVLPVENERNILITSALPYVNNVPHLGNIIGCVLSADVFARYCRLCNYNTLYICGTDEYGTATETKALSENMTPQQICDKYFQIHNDIYRWFGIGFDYFGRTTTPEQTEICQEMFLKLLSNGFILTQSVDQLFCTKCERFLADRFVEGGCPHPNCNYEDARGDQCDGCGKLVNATELKNPRCKLCSHSPKIQSSEQFFLDLPKIEPTLKLWMENSSSLWSNNARVIGNSWLREGLKPRCITRDLKWGIPVPLEQYKSKVFYVWFDAPIGYMSITKKYAPKDWLKWWRPEPVSAPKAKVELFQFMAKDNVPFHSVMFPATLLASKQGYTTVTNIMATEYLNYEDGKFSKSRGVGVFGNDAQDTGIPADVWRFYLLYVRPESQDSSFSWSDLVTKNNSELLNNLGNFVNRALVFAEKNFNSKIPEMKLNNEDYTLLALCNREMIGYTNALEKGRLRDGIRHILSISRHGNQYMQANQPWVLLKGTELERERAGTVIGVSCNLACMLAILIHPYMPETSRVLKKQVNIIESSDILIPLNMKIRVLLPTGHQIGKPSPLFSKIDPAKIEELKLKYGGQQNENVNEKRKSPEVQNLIGNNLSDLEKAVADQADKVRKLKTSGAEKIVWQPEVDTLLHLKKYLATLKEESNTKNISKNSNDSSKNEIANKNKIVEVEKEISLQGEKVRKLKSSGVEKNVWEPEVNILLALKQKLLSLGGTLTQPKDKSKKNKK